MTAEAAGEDSSLESSDDSILGNMFQPVCQRTSQNGRGATNGNRAPECRAPAARRAIPSASSTGNTANANANAGGASSATSARGGTSNVDSNRRMLSLGVFVDSRTATIPSTSDANNAEGGIHAAFGSPAI